MTAGSIPNDRTIRELEHALNHEIGSNKHQEILQAVNDGNVPATYETPGMLELGSTPLLLGKDTPISLSKMEIPACGNASVVMDEGMGDEDTQVEWNGGECWAGSHGLVFVGSCQLTLHCLWDFAVQYRKGRSQCEWPGYWAILQCPFCANLAIPAKDKVFYMMIQSLNAVQVETEHAILGSRFIPRLCCQNCFDSNLEAESTTKEEIMEFSILSSNRIPSAYRLGSFFEASGMGPALGHHTTNKTCSHMSTETCRSRISKSATKANRGRPVVKSVQVTRNQCQNCGLVSQACTSCSGCNKQAWYCGRDCQAKHWKIHKKICRSGGTVPPPKPSLSLPTTPAPQEKKDLVLRCPKCQSNSIQEGTPFMCYACGDFVVCGSCATTPEFGGHNARPTKIAYLCGGCSSKSKYTYIAEDKPGLLLLRLLDKQPRGEHVLYARLILAQMRLSPHLQDFTGLQQDIKRAKEEYLWLANNLDYAPAQLAMATFHDPRCVEEGEVWHGPIPFHLLGAACNGQIDESPFATNRQLAIRYYEGAVQHDWSVALTTVGTMYKRGELFVQNPSLAILYLEKAADLGDALAAHNIAHMYLTGTGVQRDLIAAMRYLNQAATHGLLQSMFMVGQLGMQSPGPLRQEGRKWVAKLVEEDWEPSHEEMRSVFEQLRQFYQV